MTHPGGRTAVKRLRRLHRLAVPVQHAPPPSGGLRVHPAPGLCKSIDLRVPGLVSSDS
jgi:hypothetical protein